MKNPEDELPPLLAVCPLCKGKRELYYPSRPDEDFAGRWFDCFACDGTGEQGISQESAMEALWHSRREEVAPG